MAGGGMDFKITMDRTEEVSLALELRANLLVHKTITDIEADMKTSLTGGRSGKVYGGHQASAPGEAPASDQGQLAGGIGSQMVAPAEGEVTSDATHGRMLEKGTIHMAPRPFFVPAFDRARAAFVEACRQLLRGI